MKTRVSPIFRLIGIDRAVSYSVLGYIWTFLSGPVTILLIATRLTPEEQGFYYTFAGILALSIFAEMGLSNVILQFSSHEKADLYWSKNAILQGSETARARLSSLVRFAIRWYGVASFIFLIVVLPAGLIFFYQNQSPGLIVNWQLPWIWVMLVTTFTLFVSPFFALLEGCGLVAQVATMRLVSGILTSFSLWLLLWLGGGLFAAPFSRTIAFLWSILWLILFWRHFLQNIYQAASPRITINWRREIWPFQWRIALSWISGYLIFQLFNPILFAYQGSIVAGQMGLSLSIVVALSSISMAWINTKAPQFGVMVAKRDFKRLDHLFFASLWQSLTVVILGGTLAWLFVYFLYTTQNTLSQRVLNPIAFGFLVAAIIVNQVVFAEAAYLRAHKEEPLMVLSILNGILMAISTYFFGRYYGATAVAAGYFTIQFVVGLGFGTFIFIRKRSLWHKLDNLTK